MINLPNTIAKGQNLTFALNKELVTAAITDEYWSDSANISKCIVVYKARAGKGRQRKRLVFDFTQETPTATIEWSTKARNAFQIDGIVLMDFDNGTYTLSRSELPLNASFSFASVGEALSEFEVFTSSGGSIVKTAENQYVVWGENSYNRLNPETQLNYVVSPSSALFDIDYSTISSAKRNHSNAGFIGLEKSTGRLYGWGRNIHGETGVPNGNQPVLTPTAANTDVLFSQISQGLGQNGSNSSSLYGLGIEKDTGKLYTWGTRDNYFGSLARSVTNYSTPLLATNASHLTFKKVYAGATATALTTEGALYVWGGFAGNTPILIDDSRNYVDVVATAPIIRAFRDIAIFVMDDAGKIYARTMPNCSNTSGVLGNGSTTASTTLTEIEGNRAYSKLSCGANHIAAIEAGTNKLYMWGNNSNGQLGDGTTTNRLSPTLIAPDKQFSSVRCGEAATIAVELGTNDIYVWGNQANYQLGTGSNSGNILVPTKITLPIQESQPSEPSANPDNYDGWTPALLSGVNLWLDASDESTVVLNGTTVSQWQDKSGNVRHASQANVSLQPEYVPSTLNSRSILRLTQDELSVPDLALTGQGHEVFVVMTLSGSTNSFGRLLSLRENGRIRDFDNTKSWVPIYRSGTRAEISSVQANKIPSPYFLISYDEFNLISSSLNNGLFFRANGSLIGTNATSYDLNTTDGLLIGQSLHGNDENWNGDVAEIIFTPALSDSDRQKVEGYLAHKWGLTSKLPEDHPYKTTAPSV